MSFPKDLHKIQKGIEIERGGCESKCVEGQLRKADNLERDKLLQKIRKK